MNYKVQIGLSADLAKYIRVRFGGDEPEVRITLQNVVGIIFQGFSTPIIHIHKHDIIKEKDGLVFVFPDSMRTLCLRQKDLKPLKKALYYVYREDLKVTCEAFAKMGGSDYAAVEYFMEKYGITEDDIPADVLRKRYRDFKHYHEKKNFEKV